MIGGATGTNRVTAGVALAPCGGGGGGGGRRVLGEVATGPGAESTMITLVPQFPQKVAPARRLAWHETQVTRAARSGTGSGS